MGTEASRRFIGSYSALVRRAWEHNGDTASFCMRITTQIPLYYLGGPGAAIALSANPLFDAAVTGVYKRGL
jgi:hypothetical protein